MSYQPALYIDVLSDTITSASGYTHETATSPTEYIDAKAFTAAADETGTFVLRDASTSTGKFNSFIFLSKVIEQSLVFLPFCALVSPEFSVS